MNPRIRIFVVLLASVLMAAVPSTASAASVCGSDLPPYASASLDTTAPSSAWQQGVPAGTVDVPLLGGGSVDQWQYKVDCGAPVSIIGAGGNAAVVGDGTHRLTHRAHDSVSGNWTDWTDHFVRIDSTNPSNTTTPPTTNWQRGPVNVALTATDAVSPAHTEWRVDGGSWTTGTSATVTGTGVHSLETAAVDSAGNRAERNDTVRVDNALPVDTTVTPVGWQNGAVDVPVTATDADAGVDHVEWQIDAQPVGSGPEGTVVRIGTHGIHNFRTRSVDEVGNTSVWVDHTVMVNIAGPADTTVIPSGWITDPSVDLDITADPNGSPGIQRIQWRLDGVITGDVPNTDTTPVTITGDGVHTLEVRITDDWNRVNDWHTHQVKIDTVDPVDNTTVAAGWLPLAYVDVLVRGADQHSQVQGVEWRLDGGDVQSASTNNHEVRVAGNGAHTLETRIVDNAGRRSIWKVHTVRLDSTLPTNTTPTYPGGWRNTPYAVVLDGSDAGSGVASVRWQIDLENEPAGDEHEGARGVARAEIDRDGTHVLHTRIRDAAGNFSVWRDETVRIDRVLPTDGTTYPSAPVGNRHVVTFNPQDDRSGVAGIEWKLDGGSVQNAATAQITGAGAHTLSVRVRDNAGNWSAWADHAITVVLGLDTTAPTDTTVIPTPWQLVAYTVTVTATDDVDGTGVDYVQWRYGNHPAGQGPSGSQVTISADGEHEFETRAIDKAGNATGWRRQTLRVDTTQPADATALPTTAWTNSNTFQLQATDATSGVASFEYKIGNNAPVIAANGTTVTLPGDGNYRVRTRVLDNAGQTSGWKEAEFGVDTVAPVNTSPAAPVTWQTTALALALTGTDAASGIDRAEWRVAGGAIQTGTPTAVTSEGIQTLETRVVDRAGNASTWRSESVRIDRTKPVNTTPAVSGWKKTNFTTTVTGTDATPGSGVARVEYKVDGGAVVTTPAVSITTEGPHTLSTRVVDTAGNASDWREDTLGIDKTVPTLSVDCGVSTWRSSVATCTVAATGGASGLASLTAARGTGAAEAISGTYSVETEGAATLNFRAIDGAGNEKTTTADVKIDRSPPAASISCEPGATSGWACKGTGTDGLSGVSTVKYSVDGAAPLAVGAGGTFSVTKGKVVVHVTDMVGNVGTSSPLTLAERKPSTPDHDEPHEETEEEPARSTTQAVLLRKGGAASSRLLGQLALSATASKTTVDLRPLALGKGTYQFVVRLTAGKKAKTFTKNVKPKNGYSARMTFTTSAASKAAVTLTVRKKSGKRWTTYAAASAKLG